jgi:REP element-mobilizing transposase RayT
MGRTPRAHLPGVAFHLTARLQNRDPLFIGLEARVVDLIAEAARHGGSELLAFAVMPNHLHLVVVQGRLPLARLMQPLLRRVALLVARSRGREGHVFERRYFDRPCLDASYLRNAIAYVHLNPARANLCGDPAAYPWTSHCAYTSGNVHPALIPAGVATGLQLFAGRDGCGADECRRAYCTFVLWRQTMDRFMAAGGDEHAWAAPRRPFADAGDRYWAEHLGDAAMLAHPQLLDRGMVARRPDLAAIARTLLDSERRPVADLGWLRSGGRGPELVRTRRVFVSRSLAAGYTAAQIARFLRVSPSCVSLASTLDRRAVGPAVASGRGNVPMAHC